MTQKNINEEKQYQVINCVVNDERVVVAEGSFEFCRGYRTCLRAMLSEVHKFCANNKTWYVIEEVQEK